MATTTARTKQDVDNMSKADRLWDSLNYSYGRQREASDKEYNKAYSQADRQALSRGMQRSAYNAQNLANINQQKLEAQENSWNTQIADYENRLSDIEQQELAADQWERQFAANREDAAWNKEYQQKQSDIAENQFNLQFNAGREDAAWNKEYQQAQADIAKDQWEREFGYTTGSNEQQIAMQYALNALNNGQVPSDDLLRRAGLSREDAEKMVVSKSGGSGKGSGKTSNPFDALSDADKNKYSNLIGGIGNGNQPVTDATLNRDAELAGQDKNSNRKYWFNDIYNR